MRRQFPVSVVLQLGTKTVSTPNRPSATCAIAVGAATHSGWVLAQSVCVCMRNSPKSHARLQLPKILRLPHRTVLPWVQPNCLISITFQCIVQLFRDERYL